MPNGSFSQNTDRNELSFWNLRQVTALNSSHPRLKVFWWFLPVQKNLSAELIAVPSVQCSFHWAVRRSTRYHERWKIIDEENGICMSHQQWCQWYVHVSFQELFATNRQYVNKMTEQHNVWLQQQNFLPLTLDVDSQSSSSRTVVNSVLA